MRLGATIACDFRLQWRNGFYYASGLVVIGSVIILRLLPERTVDLLLPVFIFQNVIVNSFYFAAGQLLLENGEGTRAAQRVTPQRPGEYLASKVITLGALSIAESLILTAFVRGLGSELVPLVAGIALMSAVVTPLAAALVSPYRSINEFIMPSVLYSFAIALPMLGWFGIGPRIAYDWHPLQGPLHLMGTPYAPMEPARFGYAVLLPLVWIVPLWLWSRRVLVRSVAA